MPTTEEYKENLINTVIEKSEANNWEEAVKELEIYEVEEDPDCNSYCTCGKEGLRYLFTIQNQYNGNTIFPIGSSCINKFDRSELKKEADLKEDLFKLMHAVENKKFITISSDLFSRKLLKYLYDLGAFEDNQYNHNCGYNDYKFLLKMFNKRKKNITENQKRKVSAIIVGSILPFLQKLSENKMKTK